MRGGDEGRLAQIQFSTPDFHQVAVYFTTPYFIAIENTALLTHVFPGRGREGESSQWHSGPLQQLCSPWTQVKVVLCPILEYLPCGRSKRGSFLPHWIRGLLDAIMPPLDVACVSHTIYEQSWSQ